MAAKVVLVVDDDQAIRKMLKRLLTLEGFEVTTAPDGEAALEVTQLRPPDLALVDYDLPGWNGCEVVRELKRRDHTLRVMLITGNGDADLKRRVHSLGADYLQKPLALTDVLRWAQR
jgi:DNA-binding response OmpR family regulator